jgi:HK97 gp10 family phage protein
MIKARLTKNRLPDLPREVRERAIAVINSHARNVASIARQLVPVRTGQLRDSIAVSESSLGTVRVEVGAPYGIFVELGTHNMGAQPFMFPAVENDRPGLMSDLRKVIG